MLGVDLPVHHPLTAIIRHCDRLGQNPSRGCPTGCHNAREHGEASRTAASRKPAVPILAVERPGDILPHSARNAGTREDGSPDDAPMQASSYAAAYGAWADDRTNWWQAAAEGIAWDKSWDAVVRRDFRSLRTLVPRGDAEHLLQLPWTVMSPRDAARSRLDLGQPDDWPCRALHLCGTDLARGQCWPVRWQRLA